MEPFIKHINAFTDKPFRGNPAAVVKTDVPLSTRVMQQIAREMNLSETAFILPSSTRNADLRIRWFTPSNEVPLCGHATIASFHALAEEGFGGMDNPGEYLWRLQTRSGVLKILVVNSGKRTEIKMTLPVPQFKPVSDVQRDLLPALGILSRDVDASLPVVSAGNVYVPVKKLSVIKKLAPNFSILGRVLQKRHWMGACVVTRETVDRHSDFHSRYYAPNDGINEDPVTGPLGAYALLYGMRQSKEGLNRVIGEQGDWIGRKGRVGVEVIVQRGAITGVIISGHAVTLCAGVLTYESKSDHIRNRADTNQHSQ